MHRRQGSEGKDEEISGRSCLNWNGGGAKWRGSFNWKMEGGFPFSGGLEIYRFVFGITNPCYLGLPTAGKFGKETSVPNSKYFENYGAFRQNKFGYFNAGSKFVSYE